jgi:hypothetical protein
VSISLTTNRTVTPLETHADWENSPDFHNTACENRDAHYVGAIAQRLRVRHHEGKPPRCPGIFTLSIVGNMYIKRFAPAFVFGDSQHGLPPAFIYF